MQKNIILNYCNRLCIKLGRVYLQGDDVPIFWISNTTNCAPLCADSADSIIGGRRIRISAIIDNIGYMNKVSEQLR